MAPKRGEESEASSAVYAGTALFVLFQTAESGLLNERTRCHLARLARDRRQSNQSRRCEPVESSS